MLKLLRALLTGLLVLSLPLQGLAACGLPGCVSGKAAAQHAPPGDVMVHPAAHGQHAHHAQGAAAAATDTAPVHQDHALLKCCGNACAVAVLSMPIPFAQVPTRFAAPLPGPAPLYPGVILAGLERPPRPFLA
ncbi:MAG: hypothetical protein IPI03_08065 [Rubrivivax sp.]|jgi:hypothetical protein|nr:hypothetical protein [Rubrivivax sp.]MBK7261829.1 hypothetical protein [Rubrivivax sp.]MBK8526575.1 hypothetical protein [Rubrivivax sp.]